MGDDFARAEAINNSGLVVGANIVQNRAWIWRDVTDINCCTNDLTDLVAAYCGTDQFTLILANDVNDFQWIVGTAFFSAHTQPHGFVMIPRNDECPGDIDRDGDVDVQDLNAVILAWGNCESTDPCLEDSNFDCVVDVADLVQVILDWQLCGFGVEQSAASQESSSTALPITPILDAVVNGLLTPDDLVEFLLQIQEASASPTDENGDA